MNVASTLKPVYLTEEEAIRCGALAEWSAIPDDALVLRGSELEARVQLLVAEMGAERRGGLAAFLVGAGSGALAGAAAVAVAWLLGSVVL